MSALTQFRDHCRRMAKPGAHVDGCPAVPAGSYLRPDPRVCRGCVPDDDRALFARLADEIDDYLAHQNAEEAAVPSHVDQDGFDFGGGR